METAPKMSVEGRSEKDSTEVMRMEKAVNNLKMDLTTTMEIGRSLEMAKLVGCFLASTSQTLRFNPTCSIQRKEPSIHGGVFDEPPTAS